MKAKLLLLSVFILLPLLSGCGKMLDSHTSEDDFFRAKLTLITGFTGPIVEGDHAPLLFRVDDLAWLPEDFQRNVTSCFVLAKAIKRQSVEIEAVDLHCINKDEETVLEQPVVGFVYDFGTLDTSAGIPLQQCSMVISFRVGR